MILLLFLALLGWSTVGAIHPPRPDVASSTNTGPASHVSGPAKKKKSKKKKLLSAELQTPVLPPTKQKKKPTITSANKRSATTIRLQREWKDVVQSGMGFDWIEGRPIGKKNKKL